MRVHRIVRSGHPEGIAKSNARRNCRTMRTNWVYESGEFLRSPLLFMDTISDRKAHRQETIFRYQGHRCSTDRRTDPPGIRAEQVPRHPKDSTLGVVACCCSTRTTPRAIAGWPPRIFTSETKQTIFSSTQTVKLPLMALVRIGCPGGPLNFLALYYPPSNS